jgi:hypothetical protein
VFSLKLKPRRQQPQAYAGCGLKDVNFGPFSFGFHPEFRSHFPDDYLRFRSDRYLQAFFHIVQSESGWTICVKLK